MEPKPMRETLSYLLAQMCKAHRGYANSLLTGIGLHAGQEMFLMHLWEQNGLTQSQIGEQMRVKPATLSKMLDRMEKIGLVERRPDKEDSRISRVYSTEQSLKMQEPVRTVWQGLEERTIAKLSAEERVLLRRLLLQVLENL